MPTSIAIKTFFFFPAVAVRYLTGRYLTEYAHAPEMTYERNVNVDGKHVPLKITDISRKVSPVTLL